MFRTLAFVCVPCAYAPDTHTHTHIYTHIYIYIFIHTHTHTHTHICCSDEGSSDACGVFAIVAMVGVESLVLLGDVFMRMSYTVFDRQLNRIGFAPPQCHVLPVTSSPAPVSVIFIVLAVALASGALVFAVALWCDRRLSAGGSGSGNRVGGVQRASALLRETL